MGVDIVWRIHGIGVNANMISPFCMVQTTLSGISGSLFKFVEVGGSYRLQCLLRPVGGMIVDH